jgi:hypothetical protein
LQRPATEPVLPTKSEDFITGLGPTVKLGDREEWSMSGFSLQDDTELQSALYRDEFVTGFVERWDQLIPRPRQGERSRRRHRHRLSFRSSDGLLTLGHRLCPVEVAFEAKRFRDGAIAAHQFRVGNIVAAGPGEQRTQPQQRDFA